MELGFNLLNKDADSNTNISLEDLSDVTFTSLAAGDFLYYDGVNWVNYDLFDTVHTWSLQQTFTLAPIISAFSSPGFVKNNGSGLLSGGNTVDISSDTNLAVTSPIILTGDTLSLGTVDISSNTNLAVTSPIILTNDTLSLGTVDISSNTNLAATSPIILTGDTLSLGTVDISANTNLAVSSPITLTGDTIGLNQAANYSWSGTHNFGDDVTIEVSTSTFRISNANDGDAYFYFFSSAVGDDFRLGVNGSGVWDILDGNVHIERSLTVDEDINAVSGTYTGTVTRQAAVTSPSRALSTIYQNTTGHAVRVRGSVALLYTDNNSTDTAYVDCRTGSSSPPTTEEDRVGVTTSAFAVLTNSAYISVYHFDFEVPNNHYYRVLPTTTGAGTATLVRWRESPA